MRDCVRGQDVRPAPRRLAGRRGGFTLVELLTVIMIISILVAIVMPALGRAKIVVRATQTKALLDALSKGLEMFHVDSSVGGAYPPSSWPASNPPVSGGQQAFGAHTLVWGLAGADFKGTVGFKANLASLYSDSSTSRSGPFVSMSNVQIAPAPGNVGFGSGARNYQVFLDSFDMPVLYYRANTRTTDANLVYTRDDNKPFLLNDSGTAICPLGEGGASTSTDGSITLNGADSAFKLYTLDSRSYLATNKVYSALNRESYILFSAGPDGKYGTIDDIAPFGMNTDKNIKNQ